MDDKAKLANSGYFKSVTLWIQRYLLYKAKDRNRAIAADMMSRPFQCDTLKSTEYEQHNEAISLRAFAWR